MTELQSIVEYDELDTFTDSVSTLVAESRIHFEKNGLRITAVDPANVGCVQAMLGAGAFESYEIDERAVIGIDLGRLEEALGFASSGDPVGLRTAVDGTSTTEEGETELSGFVELETDGITHDIALIGTDSIRKEPDIPDLDLPATIMLEGRQLKRSVRAADTVSDHAILEADADAFRASGEGDTDSVDVELTEEDLLEGTDLADARSLFSIDYLEDMVKAIPADAEVQLRLGTDMPAKIKWSYADGAGTCTYMIAPRIEND